MVRARRSRKDARWHRNPSSVEAPAPRPRRRYARALLPFIIAVVLVGLWCAHKVLLNREFTHPNVILISVDTLRADHLGCYGYTRDTSPNIDRLAKSGVRFTQAMSQASWTLPSHMSIMTSQYPHVHGVEVAQQALPEDATTLAKVLSRSGYETAAFISWIYVARKFGFAQGFDEFTELLPPEDQIDSTTRASFKAEQVTNRVNEWLAREHPRPFFLFVHYFDPHLNYEPPPPYDRMFDPAYTGAALGSYEWIRPYIKGANAVPQKIDARDRDFVESLYDGEIRYTDYHLGRFLSAVDKAVGLDRCLIVFTSDHGEEFNDHGSMEGHQWTLYEETIHVPLVLRLPRSHQPARVVSRPVELIDIPTTILSLLNIAPPACFQGRDLSALAKGGEMPDEPVFSFGEIRRFVIRQYVRGLRYKLIHTFDTGVNKRGISVKAGYELYDLQTDPREQHDLYAPDSPIARLLVQRLQQWNATPITGFRAGQPQKVTLTPRELQQLRSLGYVDR